MKLFDEDKEYRGFCEVQMTDDEIAEFYEAPDTNPLDALTNEYIIIKDSNDEIIDIVKWNGETTVHLKTPKIDSRYIGKVKARNTQQKLALDMLYNPDITINVLTGRFGSGKDYLMSAAAIDLIEKNKFERIIWVRNNIEVKDSKPIGYLPGDYYDKLLPFAMPLAEKLGGIDGLEAMIRMNKVELVHLGFIRGRDIKNSIVICSEAENMTTQHIQLLIGRIGEGSELWLNGDFKQTDAKVFETNNGLVRAIDRLKGHKRFGFVKLLKTERSETAAMADLLD